MRHNDIGGWGEGLSLMTFRNSEKLSNFKVHEFSSKKDHLIFTKLVKILQN